MKKQKYYTKGNWKICGILATFFSIAYFVTRSLILLDPCINAPDSVAIPVFLWDKGLPLLIIMSWLMYLERYVHFRFRVSQNPVFLQDKRSVYEQIVLLVVCSIGTFLAGLEFVFYLVMYAEHFKQVWDCNGIALFVMSAWFLGCLYHNKELKSIWEKREGISKKKQVQKIILLALLVLITVLAQEYITGRLLESGLPISFTNKYSKYYALFAATIFPMDLAGYF